MLLKPDLATAVLDPFSAQPSLILICDVAEPTTGLGYERCPRSVAERAEAHLAASGVAERILIAPQAEFCVFDDVRFAIAVQRGVLPGGFRGGRLQLGHPLRRRQQRAPAAAGRAACRAADRAHGGPARRDLDHARDHGARSPATAPRYRGRPEHHRDRRRRPGAQRRPAADLQVRRAQRRPFLRQERDLPAQAHGVRAGLGPARPAGAVARGAAAVRGPGLCRRERRLPALHRRHPAPRRARSTRSPIRPPTAIGGSPRAAARRVSWPTPRSTARPRSACRSPTGRRTSGSRRASPIRPPIPISRSPPC